MTAGTGALRVHFPNRLDLLFGIFPVPVLILVTLYVVFDAFGVLGHRAGETRRVHRPPWRRRVRLPLLQAALADQQPVAVATGRSLSRASRPELRVYRGEPTAEPPRAGCRHAAGRPTPEPDLEAELDAVLEKVARHGKSSLTEREQQILMRRAKSTATVASNGVPAMPLYEYECRSCKHTFEELVFGDETISCPECRSKKLERLISVPARPQSDSGSDLPMACRSEGPPCGSAVRPIPGINRARQSLLGPDFAGFRATT